MKECKSPLANAALGKTVFLTGGSGLLGTALLESIHAKDVIALYNRTPLKRAGVKTLQGDICKPLLGLSRQDFEALAERIDVIVHSASVTKFGVSDAKIFETNVKGTAEVVSLARRAK